MSNTRSFDEEVVEYNRKLIAAVEASIAVRQGIETKYYGPTNSRGSRIKASCAAGSIFVAYDDELNSDQMHKQAAIRLIEKLGWRCKTLAVGGNASGTGYLFVLVG